MNNFTKMSTELKVAIAGVIILVLGNLIGGALGSYISAGIVLVLVIYVAVRMWKGGKK